MKVSDDKIKDLLVKENYVSAEDMKKAEAFASSHHSSITDYLFAEELIDKSTLGQAIAESFGLGFLNLDEEKPSKEQVLKLGEQSAVSNRVIFVGEKDKTCEFATDSPQNKELIPKLKRAFKGKKIKLYYSFPESIDENLNYYKKSLETRFSQIVESKTRIAPELVEEIVEDAISYHASDIHFEPQDDVVVIRFRIDGVLSEAGRIPNEYYENILNRIKVMAQLRIDEHFATQDGAIRLVVKGSEVDMRISLAPTLDGEKITIRLLAEYVRDLTLGELGLCDKDQAMLVEAAKRPFGMILVTGPTGSGKTTTLYALIKHLNDPTKNITTIEDPVEYKIPGTNQIQVNPEKDITFAEGLRSIVRQDPDVILVGEIRDKETAEIAVNAALTGHLLFSTFHANDAATAIPRLMDMGVEPFLLSSTLNVIYSQRLVRKLCNACRYSEQISKIKVSQDYPGFSQYFSKETTIYRGKGCDICNGTGYKGRVGIFEYIKVTKEIQELMLNNPSTNEIWHLAKQQGAHTLAEDGVEKVKEGLTTLDELMRVIPAD